MIAVATAQMPIVAIPITATILILSFRCVCVYFLSVSNLVNCERCETDHADDRCACWNQCESYHFVFLLSSQFCFYHLILLRRYIAVVTRPADAAAARPATATAVIIFVSSFLSGSVVCFPCCVYIITRKCTLFNEQYIASLLLNGHNCDELLLRRQKPYKLSQNYCKKRRNMLYLSQKTLY